MTKRAPGLTAEMVRYLLGISWPAAAQPLSDPRIRLRAQQLGFVSISEHGQPKLTPRGQAALAAPRMTAAELVVLEAIEDGGAFPDDKEFSRPAKSICERGFVTPINPGEYDLTPAGLTALNNMRAAMGSAEYKEQP